MKTCRLKYYVWKIPLDIKYEKLPRAEIRAKFEATKIEVENVEATISDSNILQEISGVIKIEKNYPKDIGKITKGQTENEIDIVDVECNSLYDYEKESIDISKEIINGKYSKSHKMPSLLNIINPLEDTVKHITIYEYVWRIPENVDYNIKKIIVRNVEADLYEGNIVKSISGDIIIKIDKSYTELPDPAFKETYAGKLIKEPDFPDRVGIDITIPEGVGILHDFNKVFYKETYNIVNALDITRKSLLQMYSPF